MKTLPWRALPSWVMCNRLRILMYHSISENPRDPHATALGLFISQIDRLIEEGNHFVDLAQGLDMLLHKADLHQTIVLSFDDGYLDFYENALPSLIRRNVPSVIFIPAGLAGKRAEWDSHDPSKELMTWSHIEECQKAGVLIGSHTLTHRRLVECSQSELEDELNGSLEMLRYRIGKVFPAIAYPGGYQDGVVHLAAKKAGYICGLGGASHWGNGPETDLFTLRRERLKD